MAELKKEAWAAVVFSVGCVVSLLNQELTYFLVGGGIATVILLSGLVFGKLEEDHQATLKQKLGVKHDYQIELLRRTTLPLDEKSPLRLGSDKSWLKRKYD